MQAPKTVSVSELKVNAATILRQMEDQPIFLLHHSTIIGVLISITAWNELIERKQKGKVLTEGG